MKHLKMLGLAAVAAMALMAFLGAGTASATVLCKTTPVTDAEGQEACAEKEWDVNAESTIEASLASESAEFTSALASVTCSKSTISGTTANTGNATETVTVTMSTLSFEECKCAGGSRTAHVTALENGSLEIHHVSGTHNATLTGEAQKVTITCTGLGSCIYGTGEGADLGTVTGGNPASVSAEATISWISGDGGSFICGTTAAWKASYSVTNPNPVYSAEVAYSLATLKKTVTQNGVVDVKECKFTKENEKKENCIILFTVKGGPPNWKVEKNGWIGANPEVRYKKTVGCTVNKVMKDKESCTDEIEMIKKEAGTSNEWCVYLGSEGSSLKELPFCTKLSM